MNGSTVFFALLSAHLTAEFVLQTEREREAKRRGSGKTYVRYAAAHWLCNWAALLFLSGEGRQWWILAAAATVLAAAQVLFDWLKHGVNSSWRHDGPVLMTVDQTIRVAAIAACAAWIQPEAWRALSGAIGEAWALRGRALAVVSVYLAAVFAGAFFVRGCTRPLLEQFSRLEGSGQGSVRQLKNAGMYIGWLERFVVLTAMMLHSPATVGLVLTAKAIVRFPEMKDLRFAEYFLIGTLLSLSIALAGGVVLLKIVHGTVHIP
jgi:hypothetical protein